MGGKLPGGILVMILVWSLEGDVIWITSWKFVPCTSQPAHSLTQHDDILYCRNSQPENYVYYVLPLVVEGIPLPTPYFNFQTIKQNTLKLYEVGSWALNPLFCEVALSLCRERKSGLQPSRAISNKCGPWSRKWNIG